MDNAFITKLFIRPVWCGERSLLEAKKLIVPENMKIIHERDYSNEAFRDYQDEPYFRLYHNLKEKVS